MKTHRPVCSATLREKLAEMDLLEFSLRCCATHHVTLEDLWNARDHRRAWPALMRARAALFVCLQSFGYSTTAAGDLCGGLDHSTVLYTLRRYGPKLASASVSPLRAVQAAAGSQK